MPLLPSPPLDPELLRLERVAVSEAGPLEALVPATEAYRCRDPQAPVLVGVHGFAVNGLTFLRQLPLGGQADLHFPHLPNAPVSGERGIGHFARGIEAYIAARELDRRPGGLVLVGTSMGGAVSLAVASRGRVKLRGLVLICTYGSSKHLALWKRWAAPLVYGIPVALFHAAGKWLVRRTARFDTFSPGEGDWMVQGIDVRTREYLGRAACALTRLDLLEEARRLTVPTLVVHGRNDHILPYAAGVELAQVIPGARMCSLEGAGHAVFFVRHEEVNTALAQFLATLP